MIQPTCQEVVEGSGLRKGHCDSASSLRLLLKHVLEMPLWSLARVSLSLDSTYYSYLGHLSSTKGLFYEYLFFPPCHSPNLIIFFSLCVIFIMLYCFLTMQ